MAPTDTNTEKSAKKHATPLIGMAVLVVLVLLGFLWWVTRATSGPEEVEVNPAEAPASSAAPSTTQSAPSATTPPVESAPENNSRPRPRPEATDPAPNPTAPGGSTTAP